MFLYVVFGNGFLVFVKRFKKVLGYVVATSLKLMGGVLMDKNEMLIEITGNPGCAEVVYGILTAVKGVPGWTEDKIGDYVSLDEGDLSKYLETMVGDDLLCRQEEKYSITSEGLDYHRIFESVSELPTE